MIISKWKNFNITFNIIFNFIFNIIIFYLNF